MLGMSWKNVGKSLTANIEVLFWRGSGLLLTAVRQYWIWCSHVCKSLKHINEKGMKHHTCFKSPKDLVIQSAGTSLMECTASYFIHLMEDLRSSSEKKSFEEGICDVAMLKWPSDSLKSILEVI